MNLLISLAWPSHVHHVLAQGWFAANRRSGWATCPLTQLAFVRISSNPSFVDGAVSPREAWDLLCSVASAEDHEFWPDAVSFAERVPGPPPFLVGHRQVTDAYLLRLAQHYGGKLATIDRGIRTLLPESERSRWLEIVAE